MNFNQCKHRLGGSNSGFTLVELLFVIAIISVLSTLSLGIMLSAQDDAKESATLSRIRQVEAILQIELEEYEVRRLPIRTRDLIPGGAGVGVRMRNLRRRIIADIINAELPTLLVNQNGTPDPNDDSFVIPELGVFPTNQPSVMQPGDGSIERMGFRDWLDDNFPGLASDLEGVASSRVTAWSSVIAMQDIPNGKIFDLPGEYLYEALRRINLDGDPAIETLGNQAVGDSDGDGFGFENGKSCYAFKDIFVEDNKKAEYCQHSNSILTNSYLEDQLKILGYFEILKTENLDTVAQNVAISMIRSCHNNFFFNDVADRQCQTDHLVKFYRDNRSRYPALGEARVWDAFFQFSFRVAIEKKVIQHVNYVRSCN